MKLKNGKNLKNIVNHYENNMTEKEKLIKTISKSFENPVKYNSQNTLTKDTTWHLLAEYLINEYYKNYLKPSEVTRKSKFRGKQ